jgi:hypothetical protein
LIKIYIMHSNDVIYNLFAVMESSIKTGNTCWRDSLLLNCKEDDKEEEITKNSFSQLYKDEEVRDLMEGGRGKGEVRF